MAKELTPEEAKAKIAELEADNKKLTAENIKLTEANEALEMKVGSLEEALQETQETALAEIKQLKEENENLRLQKAGELKVVKISEGEYAGSYQFTAASFKLRGTVYKAAEISNDDEVLVTLVKMKAGVIRKKEETNA